MTLSQGSFSLNEVESLCAKAVRGAGAPWGLAEDVARATRWLAERGFDWTGPLLRLLAEAPVAGHLRPAFWVADLLAGGSPGDAWRIEGCEPVWVVPVLSAALYGRGLILDLAWDAQSVRLQGDGQVSADAPLHGLEALGPREMRVAAASPGSALAEVISSASRRSVVPRSTWDSLARHAACTYVPATAESRATGAGGGRVDAE